MNIKDNRGKNRFEAVIDGYMAFVEYTVKPGILVLEHTEVDKALGGKGIGGELVESVLLEMELRGLKAIPKCPFIKRYIEKHPEWKSILAE